MGGSRPAIVRRMEADERRVIQLKACRQGPCPMHSCLAGSRSQGRGRGRKSGRAGGVQQRLVAGNLQPACVDHQSDSAASRAYQYLLSLCQGSRWPAVPSAAAVLARHRGVS